MGDFVPVTRTKIIVPRRRADLLARARLLELLDELLDNRLIIVAAPAGYGKTSLMVDFAHTYQWPVCWYSLDTLDQDPLRFIAHFISAISQRFPNFGKSCIAALQNMGQDRLDLDVLSSLIINDIYENITEHFMFVIDDFHLVESSKSIVYFVNRFIQDADENCHLVLASRTLLTLPDLPLMVARAQVGGLSFEELTFQPSEIQSLLQQNYQLSISTAEATELARDTEGWITGLLLSTQLMGKTLANRMRVARVSGVGLYEYLAQQVLAQQSEEVQAFLLRSSLLEEFDARLCEEVLGAALNVQAPWRDLMEAVLRHNLFVLPVGDEGLYLRYHHLFQDFLRDRMLRERPAEAEAIQRRLAAVFVQHDEWERAYQLYQRIGDTQAIADLVENAGSYMIAHSRLQTLTEWFEALPLDLMQQRPALISLRGAAAVQRGELRPGLQLLEQAAEILRDQQAPLQLAHTLVRRTVAYRMLGQYRSAYQDAEEALSLVSFKNSSRVIYTDALLGKGMALYYLGQLNELLTWLRQALLAYQSLGDKETTAKVWMEVGMVSKALGRFDEAERAYSKSLEHYHEVSNLSWQGSLYNNLGVLQHSRGDYVAATTSFERAIHYARASGSQRLEAYILTSIGDLYQELGAYQETREAYQQAREIAQRAQDGYLCFYLNLVEARLSQSLGEIDQACEWLREAQSMADERDLQYEQNVIRLERGRLKLVEKKPREALAEIEAALDYFAAEGYQAEEPRARLYHMIACKLASQRDCVESELALLEPLLANPEKLRVLAAVGYEMLPYLEKLESEPHAAIAALLQVIRQHEQDIPGLRRVIRRHAVVVPFAPPKMTIRSFGKVQVSLSDRIITSSEWQVQTARDLFFLLLAHPEGLTKEQIGEIFWPDSTPSELKLRFKNTIYRLRHAAGKEVILFQGESFYLLTACKITNTTPSLSPKKLAWLKPSSALRPNVSIISTRFNTTKAATCQTWMTPGCWKSANAFIRSTWMACCVWQA